MRVRSDSFTEGQRLPDRLAFGVHDPESHVRLSDNRSPHLAWSDVPEGTASFAIVCHDPDVPSRGDDVNQEGRTVPASLPRVDFFHLVAVDLDPATRSVAEGAFGDGVVARGKEGPTGPLGTRVGVNDYTGWFASDADMKGDYYGYDGPCPPWNDSILHHYVFTVYALDVARAPVDGRFDGHAVREALADHILAEASITGTFAINPDVR